MTEIESSSPARRRSFRKRLVVSQGLVLLIAFTLIGILGWMGTYGWLHYHARSLLEHEAEEIQYHIVQPNGSLDLYRYAWQEPHHIYREERVDPFFVQVFDPRGQLLHASANVYFFATDKYPSRPLPATSSSAQFLSPLSRFDIDDTSLYFEVYPIPRSDGSMLGYIQIARYEPGIAAILRNTALGLIAGLGSIFTALMLLTNWVAGRVVAPLKGITSETRHISPHHLDHRITVLPEADEETTRLAETLNRLLDRIETSFQEMKRFTSNAAHELQTPLTVLRGHIDVALRRPRDQAAYRKTLELLGEEVDEMTVMVHDLLVLARLDRDQFTAELDRLNLCGMVRHILPDFRTRAEMAGLQWSERCANEVWVEGHPGLLREAIENILDNAIKYTPAGSIRVELQPANGQHSGARLQISDTGIGMSEQTRLHATDRFFRAEQVQGLGIPGSGLGLSIVSQIAAFHQGRLFIDSSPEGTCVTIELPDFMRDL